MKSRASAAADRLARPRLALGLSGGGDSTALLLALRAVYPDVALHALIVDHGLRAQSAAEARTAAEMAERAGAVAQILRWSDPRPGQAHARKARHRLLAAATRQAGATLLCLAHTRDDRVETLRMRAARSGPPSRMAGPGQLDASPAWPEGDGVTLARPFLMLERSTLRDWLTGIGASWIEDPGNQDPAYERVRLRAAPLDRRAEEGLLRRSDAARTERAVLHHGAHALIRQGAGLTSWGGAHLCPARFAAAERAVALKALEALVMAVAGAEAAPAPQALERLLAALLAGEAMECGGAHLTPRGVLGREAGAAGRADGAPGAAPLRIDAGQTGVFDGRWRVHSAQPVWVTAFGARTGGAAAQVPAALRPGLAALRANESGPVLALPGLQAISGGHAELLCGARISARLLPPGAPTWFDGEKVASHVCAALANPAWRANMV